MARPSKLTDAQWIEIQRRYLAGETDRALGKEFGISDTGIRKRLGSRFSSQSSQTIKVAHLLAESETALQQLPLAHRGIAIDLAERLRNISHSVAAAAELGAKTGHRLHALANSEVGKVDDAAPLSETSIAALKGVGVLTKLANESLMPALNLLSANKEQFKPGNADDSAIDATQMTDDQLAYHATKRIG